MPILHAIVLGLVQGLSEFLPISSSGHLLLVPWLFGWDDFDSESVEKAFDVALHIGTLIAAIAYFRHDLAIYVRDGMRRRAPARPAGDDRGPRGLAAASCRRSRPPLVGALFESQIDEQLGTPTIIAVSLILGGLLLAWADRTSGTRKVEDYAVRDALIVGAAQALALNPGTSRSGITITAGRFLRLRPRRGRPHQLPDDDPGHHRCRAVQDGRPGHRRHPRRARWCRCSSAS